MNANSFGYTAASPVNLSIAYAAWPSVTSGDRAADPYVRVRTDCVHADGALTSRPATVVPLGSLNGADSHLPPRYPVTSSSCQISCLPCFLAAASSATKRIRNGTSCR